ncbi:MAG: UDP-N-acetylmuramoyl-tripeptide--D-alanyl-D-alanine ligase [Betaproteobacteria bacterium HGW-Betaproteobacteria-8]|nr:MAG: UDP-N-acetylmuramoyl-tripeptide--D-alanyl-D-alanine ligase [Betaproteobacteria bacterium HGW-Betaproteobacteria-8]
MMRLSEAAVATRGKVLGEDVLFTCVTNDSRGNNTGQLFIAMRGERVDGHDFAVSAIGNGAVAAMVSHAVDGLASALLVEDTRLALGDLAAYWRGKFTIPLAAVTGSNGKTTVKEMLASILRATAGSHDLVLATEGNLNNDIGLPLTLLKLRQQHRYAVAEMGMNHFGEISYLTHIGRPTVALINNATTAHLGGLGSVDGIAKAKGEIFEGLAADGVAVINVDDEFAPLWKSLAANHSILSFGLSNGADITASFELHTESSILQLKTPLGEAGVNLPVAGRHNVCNALAATATAIAMGAKLPHIVAGLEAFAGIKGRLQRKRGINGAVVIDDTYNANPASMKAAIDVLAARPGDKLLVLGDMGELGGDADKLHAEIGDYAKRAGISALYVLGELSLEMVKAFGAGGLHFETPAALCQVLEKSMHETSTVLVKGSRFMRMERVVDLITENNSGGNPNAA